MTLDMKPKIFEREGCAGLGTKIGYSLSLLA
jgi:hypothetical protein